MGELCHLRASNGVLMTKKNESTRVGDRWLANRKPEIGLDKFYKQEDPCLLSDLVNLEETTPFANLSRILLVSSDRKRKLNPFDEDETVKIPSRSLSLYETTIATNSNNDTTTMITNDTIACSICLNGIWSSTLLCKRLYYAPTKLSFCDRDELDDGEMGRFILDGGSEAVESQNLFESGRVQFVKKLSETTSVCRVCNENGEWSKYAESRWCDPKLAFSRPIVTYDVVTPRLSCQLDELNFGSIFNICSND